MSALDAGARAVVLKLLHRIEVGTLVVAERGRHRTIGSGPPVATIEVLDARLWRALLHGSRGMAEAYAQGWWDSPDLVAVIRLAARNGRRLDGPRRRLAAVRGPLQLLRAVRPASDARPQPPRHLCPLRPRKRAVLAHARSDSELLVRASSPSRR